VILTKAQHPRAKEMTVDEMRPCFSDKDIFPADGVEEALELAGEIVSEDEVILVAGSLFLAAEARRIKCGTHPVLN